MFGAPRLFNEMEIHTGDLMGEIWNATKFLLAGFHCNTIIECKHPFFRLLFVILVFIDLFPLRSPVLPMSFFLH